jgi:hypothetical protein
MDEKARAFEGAASQWNDHLSLTWRKWWINEAEKWQDKIPEAKAHWKKFASSLLILQINYSNPTSFKVLIVIFYGILPAIFCCFLNVFFNFLRSAGE